MDGLERLAIHFFVFSLDLLARLPAYGKAHKGAKCGKLGYKAIATTVRQPVAIHLHRLVVRTTQHYGSVEQFAGPAPLRGLLNS